MIQPITQQLQRFADDERAVSPVVGFVLMFALIMIVFTIYQAEVVPAQNEEVEFKHSQTVEGEISQLNDAIQQAGTSGVPQSATIATGVQYPDRALAINPGAPAGTLKTVAADVTISDVSGSTDYWDSTREFDTALVKYESNYNILQQETTYTLENGMFVKNFENGNNLLASDDSLISNEGQRINLVLVGGDYQESAMTTSVTVTPVSTSSEYLQFDATESNPSITIPTTLSESEWKAILDGDPDGSNDGKNHVSFGGYDSSGDPHTVTIRLDSDIIYELRLTKVSLGGGGEPTTTYLKSENPRNPDETIQATVGESETFTVSARDEFGNPVDKATVSANIDSTPIDKQTNDDGRATFTYTPTSDDAGSTVTVEIELKDESGTVVDTVTYELNVEEDENGANDGNRGIGNIDNGYDIDIIITGVSQSGNGPVEITFENRGDEEATATHVRISGFSVQGGLESGDTISFAGADIPLNGNLEPLNNEPDGENNEFDILSGEDDNTTTVNIDPAGNQGAFLIMDIEFEVGGETVVGTYAVSIPK